MCYFNITLNIFFSWSTADVFLREVLANPLAKKLGSTKFENKRREEIKKSTKHYYEFFGWFQQNMGIEPKGSRLQLLVRSGGNPLWKPTQPNVV